MAQDAQRLRREAVLLSDRSLGVATETKSRRVQSRDGRDAYRCSLNPEWLQQLNLGEQGAETVHSMSLGMKPVIVQQPAIIVQPMSVLEVSD
ncbi:hypothetical protein EGH24_13795 [Halonotius terrestris]|uniref:Uncharacterized protein n=1 Tax=Halonotius terrestris TaxID=2487750 RepID=A0A8J8P6R8_9EURY|nr:hypothetical protein [Halonotius terrestris]TQQ78590.1 hypothetical protein EGH24_13795 [Halonotius terrestris]